MDPDDQPEILTKQGLYTGFKVLLKYIASYRRDITILSVMGVLSAIGNGIIPYVAGRFFDSVITPGTFVLWGGMTLKLYVAVLVIWAAIQLATYLLDWRIQLKSEYLSNTIWLDYAARGFGFLVNLPMSFHKKNKIGDIGNQINTAAGSLETVAGRIVIDLAPQILSIVIAFCVAFYMMPLMALVLAIGLGLYIFVLVRKVPPLSGYQKEYRKHMHELYGDSYDMIGNTMAIKQATAEAYEHKRMHAKKDLLVPLWMKLTNTWGALSLYQRLTILATQIVIFAISAMHIQAGTMTLGELIAFNAYAAMIFGPFVTIARNWQTIHTGIVNVQETEKILALAPELYEPHGSVDAPIRGDIVFKNVSFQYDEGKPVLSDVSFSVSAGDVVALVGESGVGKSTLIDLISGYHFPSQGEVTIDRVAIQAMHLRSLRRQIAVVPQEVVLFNDTIEKNIKYGNFAASHEEMEAAAKKAHAYDFIQKFPNKWQQMVGERGVKLSVGQKQRVAIARAVLRDPRILVLDEPTAALDAGSEKIITESLDTLMQGKTTFIIAHRLSTVRKADKIIVLKEGRVIESGNHAELIAINGGEYRRLYELQFGEKK